MTETKPNHFYDPERAILGGMILDKSIFTMYKDALRPDFFEHPIAKKLYKFMLKSADTIKEWDIIIFNSYCETEGGKSLFEWCDMYSTSEGVKEYVKIISARYMARKLIEDGRSADEKVFEISQFLEDFKRVEAVREVQTTESMFNEAIDYAQVAHEQGPEMPYPYSQLSKKLGGLYREEVTLIIGGTIQSKTVFAHNCLRPSIEKKKKILMYDFELPARPIIHRLTAMNLLIPLDWMKAGETTKGVKLDKEQKALMSDYMANMRDMIKDRLIIKGPSSLAEIEADISSHKPDIVTIDTIQAMTDSEIAKKGESESAQLARIASGLQSFAKKYKIALLEVAQVTKDNQTAIPKISDIYGSSVIANKAANIIAVRDRHSCTKKDEDLDVYDAVIRKSRHGQGGSYRYAMNKEIARISEGPKIGNLETQMEKGF